MAENPKQAVAKVLTVKTTATKVVAAKPATAAAKPSVAKKKVVAPKKVAVKKVTIKKVKPTEPKSSKPAKVKTVRETFSMPASDYALLMQIKKRCRQDGLKVKRGELLCLGLSLLEKLPVTELAKVLKKV